PSNAVASESGSRPSSRMSTTSPRYASWKPAAAASYGVRALERSSTTLPARAAQGQASATTRYASTAGHHGRRQASTASVTRVLPVPLERCEPAPRILRDLGLQMFGRRGVSIARVPQVPYFDAQPDAPTDAQAETRVRD